MSDKEPLQPPLDGSDLTDSAKVSASHQVFSTEKPSVELDERILAAARNSVAQALGEGSVTPLPVKEWGYQKYSIAASVCLSILVVTMFVNNAPPGAEMAMPALSENDMIMKASRTVDVTRRLSQEVQAEEIGLSSMSIETASVVSTAKVVETTIMNQPQAASMKVLEPSPYRDSLTTWLLEIQRLINLEAELGEELALFSEAHPNVNLERALSELE